MAAIGRVVRRSVVPWLSGLLLLYVLLSVVSRCNQRQLPVANRVRQPFCRPDMKVIKLPPMEEDDMTLIRNLFVYLTSSHVGACVRIAKFGGTPKMRHDNIPAMDGQKNVCMDQEFDALFGSDCLVYTASTAADTAFDTDVTAFDCQVAHIILSGDGGTDEVKVTAAGSPTDLTYALHRLGHENRTIQLLSVSADSQELALLGQEVDRGRRSVLFRNVRQLVVRHNFERHIPFKRHVNFYREVYSSLLGLQSFGFYSFSNEPNYFRDANMVVPGLAEKVHPSMDVAWLKTECIEAL